MADFSALMTFFAVIYIPLAERMLYIFSNLGRLYRCTIINGRFPKSDQIKKIQIPDGIGQMSR